MLFIFVYNLFQNELEKEVAVVNKRNNVGKSGRSTKAAKKAAKKAPKKAQKKESSFSCKESDQ